MKSGTIKRIYGWREQNVAAWGIELMDIEIDIPSDDAQIESDGEIWTSYLEGRWFTTFTAAKRAAIVEWKNHIRDGVKALRHIRKQRKGDLK